jgi:hypothetical protein
MIRRLVCLLAVAVVLGGCRSSEETGEGEERVQIKGNIGPHTPRQYVRRFAGGERACVLVHPCPLATDVAHIKLKLRVYDQSGTEVARDDAGAAYCAVQWFPPQTGSYLIEVINPSSSEVRFVAHWPMGG